MDFLLNDLQKLFSIIVVDLVLSGDNAIVIGMAARTLPDRDRKRAIVWGGAGAVGLRVVFTIMAALLLDIPLIQAIGGLLLIWIAIRLVTPESEVGVARIATAGSFAAAVQTIVLADVVMSLDNILAVGGASEGNLSLLIFGLMLSIPLLLFGSNLMARILHAYPWLLLLGVLVLIHSAVTMIAHDHLVEAVTHHVLPQWEILGATLVISAITLSWVRHRHGGLAGLGPEPAGYPALNPDTGD